jgi:myo-inositol-1(or 4)-monophosphatase
MNTPLMNVMSAAAIKAGKGLMRDFGEVDQLHISRKGAANFVTSTDLRTEKLLQKELAKARPDFGFLLEEGGEVPGKDASQRWIIDPVDGTTNFIHAIPYFCVSIALEKKDASGKSEIIAGVIFDPIHNDLFTAEKGGGAFLNGRKLVVSTRASLEDAMLVTGNHRQSPAQERAEAFAMFDEINQSGGTLRFLGATALDLANLAAGRIDACWYHMIKPWDIAAGLLLIKEAGGQISDTQGKPVDTYASTLLASNRHLHAPMLKLLARGA